VADVTAHSLTLSQRRVNKEQFIGAVQAHVARVAVSASAARGQGAGVVKAARDFLTELSLGQLGRFPQPMARSQSRPGSAAGCRVPAPQIAAQ
jgi:hypothetical protein